MVGGAWREGPCCGAGGGLGELLRPRTLADTAELKRVARVERETDFRGRARAVTRAAGPRARLFARAGRAFQQHPCFAPREPRAALGVSFSPRRMAGSREGFLAVYADLRDELLAELPAYGMPPEVATRLREVIEYNVPGGKLNRGLTVVHALETLRGSGTLPAADARRAAVLGWAIEWLQAFFLVADDIMDASPTRRGAPCWYRVPAVGMVAINDAFILQSQLYKMLKRHFGGGAEYVALVDLFLETTFKTELGQNLDLTAQAPGAPLDLARFTQERYESIVVNKTSYYTFHLPVCCALILAGHGAAAAAPGVADICERMGT